jgi:SAM-dependent methyltransferase
MKIIGNLYKHLLEAELKETAGADLLPEPVRRCFVNWGGFEALYLIRKLVGESERVLVIGDWWGRDYWSLRILGKKVTALDIAPQKGIDHLIQGDVTKPLPFRDNAFDAVVMGEVLEHLIEDKIALENISRVLTPKGRLILTVPFLHDEPEYHVRIHTPKSIQRLLEACGFEVRTFITRGLVSLDYRAFKMLVHSFNLCSYIFTKRTYYCRILTWLSELSLQIGQKAPGVLRYPRYWGGYLECCKTEKRDFRKMNIKVFSTLCQ